MTQPAAQVRGLGPFTETVQARIDEFAGNLAAEAVAYVNSHYIQQLLANEQMQREIGWQAGLAEAKKQRPYFAAGAAALVLLAGWATYKAATV